MHCHVHCHPAKQGNRELRPRDSTGVQAEKAAHTLKRPPGLAPVVLTSDSYSYVNKNKKASTGAPGAVQSRQDNGAVPIEALKTPLLIVPLPLPCCRQHVLSTEKLQPFSYPAHILSAGIPASGGK